MAKRQKKQTAFRILSIDGGGVKGLYSATILEELEKRYGRIADYFDLICGTSTGGIIALGLSAGIPAKHIADFYRERGPLIFKRGGHGLRLMNALLNFVWRSKYSSEPLQQSLSAVFKDIKMKDAQTRLVIPSVDLASASGIVFKTPHHVLFTRDGEIAMSDVALATSAAPTYFPIAQIRDHFQWLADGGLWANNPSLLGVIEAMSYFVGPQRPYSTIDLLSLSNLNISDGFSIAAPRSPSIARWIKPLIACTLSSQSKAVENLMDISYRQKVFPISLYYRFRDPEIQRANLSLIELDNASPEALRLFEEKARSETNRALSSSQLHAFFAVKGVKDWKLNLSKE